MYPLVAVLFGVGLARTTCPNFLDLDQSVPLMTCANPLQASIEYLTSTTPTKGPCAMHRPDLRFDRFREWLNSIGGYASPKISFRRPPGGIFLNDHEVLVQGELLFQVPDEATFNERMVLRIYPWMRKFEFSSSIHFWQSVSLAALLKNHPEVVGPWQALLPDMTEHPVMWSERHWEDLKGTQAFLMLRMGKDFITAGCKHYEKSLLSHLDLSCTEVLEAYAILISRGFGMEGTSIPFGPDLLNHNPNTVSWISQVKHGRASKPSKIETIFYLLSYTLDESRELFNNYGPHALPHGLAVYGFTSPDPHDELVIHATTNGLFSGPRFQKMNVCPSRISLNRVVSPEDPICSRLPEDRIDVQGAFRLTRKDTVNFVPGKNLHCRNAAGSFSLRYAVKRFRERNMAEKKGITITLFLNVGQLVEPWVPFTESLWLALCFLEPMASPTVIDALVEAASVCEKPPKNDRNIEEYPKHHVLKRHVGRALHQVCSVYEHQVLGGLEPTFHLWLAYRNERIRRSGSSVVTERLPFIYDLDALHELLGHIVAKKTTTFIPRGERNFPTNLWEVSNFRLYQLEEVSKYKFQTAYLVHRKCIEPLDHILYS